ncbi:thiol-disulfide isomerase [Burkholderiales bacterium GJ-E10]|nr:thiol-disulfide isomerase [Burkholderiales bacterium GJ-E10]
MIGLTIGLAFLAGLALVAVGWRLLGRAESGAARPDRRRGLAALALGAVACIASATGAVRAGFLHATVIPLASAGSALRAAPEAVAGLEDGLPEPFPAPDFAGIAAWINSPPLTMAGLRGKVVLIDFWTYSCINCVRTLPYLTAWDRKYRRDGLVIVGVHAPEFRFETRLANVQAAVARYGIRYPVALDSGLHTWSNFHNEYWPAHYLIDRRGRVVYTHFGEGQYDVTENNIRVLLGLHGKVRPDGTPVPISPVQTPETYLGYLRAERFAGTPAIEQGAAQSYRFPALLPPDSWALRGSWSVGPQKITALAPDAAIRLRFTGRKVFLVLGTSTGSPVRATILLNGSPPQASAGRGAPGGTATIARDTLYELIDQGAVRSGVVEIRADQPGLEAYAFTFGS